MRRPRGDGVSYIFGPTHTGFGVPASALARVLSGTGDAYVVASRYGELYLDEDCPTLHIAMLDMYKEGTDIPFQWTQFIRLQARLALKQFSLRRKVRNVVCFQEFPPLPAIILSRALGIRVVWLLSSRRYLTDTSLALRVSGMMSKIAMRFCDTLVVYSESLVSFWQMDGWRHKIAIGHEHVPDLDRLRITTEWADRPMRIGYLGRLNKEKGVLNFVSALPAVLKDHPKLTVRIGGTGLLEEEVRDLIRDKGLQDRVEMAGWVGTDGTTEFLNGLRLIVIPSYTEGLPNVMLESLSCGTPTLCSPVGAIPDIVKDGVNGFLMKGNSVQDIEAGIRRALESDLSEMSREGRRTVERDFTLESAVANWKNILKRE